ncbi:MAG TPA: LegC family aminotransferase [Clostridia bacterium]|nr:LegC family aminotransferase [Clostridia bacterium]
MNNKSESGYIPLSVPEIGGNEWKYIKDCLDTGWVSSVGSYVIRFESELATYVGAPHAVATCNGTSALHIALLVAGVQPDDEVVMPSLTFIAPANAVRYAGAWPAFVDSERSYWQMDAEGFADFLANACEVTDGVLRNRHTGRRVSAVMPVHILGHPADLDAIMELAQRYGLKVIEDATECLGANYRGRPVGTHGDVGCYSFNGNKIVTTGGGGMLVTANAEWAARARYLTTQAKDDAVEFVHNAVGYNYRLTNVQAAMGCAQLELLQAYIEKKRTIARRYHDELGRVPGVTLMPRASWAEPNWWLYTVLIDPVEYGMSSRELMRLLQAEEIESRPLWQPMHLSPAHSQSYAHGCGTAEWLNERALSLPCSVGLTDEAQERVIRTISAARR